MIILSTSSVKFEETSESVTVTLASCLLAFCLLAKLLPCIVNIKSADMEVIKFRAKLSPKSLELLGDPKSGVAIRASKFAGRGVFVTRSFQKGTTVCKFRGRSVKEEEILKLPMTQREAHSRYMICHDQGACCVPLVAGHCEPPHNMPAHLSGSLINEACEKNLREFPANVVVQDTGEISDVRCPWLRDLYLEWDVVALRDIYPGEELLLCYGNSYGNRVYNIARSCCGI